MNNPTKQYSREIEVCFKSFRQARQVCEMIEQLLKTSDKCYGISKSSDQYSLVYDDVKLIFCPIHPVKVDEYKPKYSVGITGSFYP
jgi:hypothetical protein